MSDSEEESKGARVQVVVRVRPVLPSEIQQEVAVTCSPDGSRVQVMVPQRAGEKEQLPGAARAGAKSFKFDACLPGSTTQEELFETCGMAELVDAALDGYSVTIFAFGQTGSGKTHTMIGPRLSRAAGAAAAGAGTGAGAAAAGCGDGSGPGEGAAPAGPSDDGVLPRCVQYAYDSIASRQSDVQFTVSASVLELYNETVTDLLGPDKGKQLQVRKDERDGFQVPELTQVQCSSATSTLSHMRRALAVRQTRSHRLNDYSSRSHCIMTFVFASQEKVDGGGGAAARQQGAKGGIRRYGKLVLVDLAGSERLKETGNTDRDAVRETGFINKSLFTLGQVLAALSARSSSALPPHVPYRDSKLTQLLWDGLRGTGRALMLACLGPTMTYADESVNTLHFAGMAQRIKASPVVLLDPQDQLVLDLRNTIRQLQEENRQLAQSLQQLSSGADIQDVIDLLPDKLRAAAGMPGPPPDSAPAAVGGRLSRGPGGTPPATAPAPPPPFAAWGAPGSGMGSPSHADGLRCAGGASARSPWRSADDSQLPPTPSNANVLRLQPLPASSLGSPARGKAAGKRGAAGGSQASAAASAAAAAYTAPRSKASSAPSAAASPLSPPLGAARGGDVRAAHDVRVQRSASTSSPSPTAAAVGAFSALRASETNPFQGSGSRLGLSSSSSSPAPRAGAAALSLTRRSVGVPASPLNGGNGYELLHEHGSGSGGGGGRDSAASWASLSTAQTPPGRNAARKAVGKSYANLKLSKQGTGAGAGAGGMPPRPGATPGTPSASAVDPIALLRPPAPLLDPGAFPELAALEAEFQMSLAAGPSTPGQPATAAAAAAGFGTGRLLGSAVEADKAGGRAGAGGGGGGSKGGAQGLRGQGAGEDVAAGSEAVARGDAAAGAGDEEGPDVRALKWAVKNPWFGTDLDMTMFAYKAHDQLVDVQHLDPSSDAYYMQLEVQVAAKFPERWQAWHQRRQREQQQLAEERARERAPPPAEASAAKAFGRALRVAVKDALTPAGNAAAATAGGSGSSSGGYTVPSRVYGFRNLNCAGGIGPGAGVAVGSGRDAGSPSATHTARLNAAASASASGTSPSRVRTAGGAAMGVHGQANGVTGGGGGGGVQGAAGGGFQAARLQQQLTPQRSASPVTHGGGAPPGSTGSPGGGAAPGSTGNPGSGAALGGLAGSRVGTGSGRSPSSMAAESASFNPFNLHALNPPSPAKARKRNARAAAGPSDKAAATARAAAAARPRATLDALPSPLGLGTYEDMQAEYLRQRALVVNELRLAKEQAEVERARIMSTIGKMLGASRYRK